MKPLFVFNPEHDLALANGDRHYIPPKNIREMAQDLSPLMEQALGSAAEDESLSEGRSVLQPWGWDFAIVERFKKMGVPVEELPTENAIEALCKRSERATAHHLLRAFREEHPGNAYVGKSVLLCKAEDIASYADRYGHILLKAPLSGSGKGLRHVRGLPLSPSRGGTPKSSGQSGVDISSSSLEKIKSWASALIHRHGYLTAEPFYTKVADFAMEFCVSDAACRFIGYSLFMTDHHGRYIESRLLSDEAIEEVLTQYVSIEDLREVCRWICAHSGDIVPSEWDTVKYPLHFGIDMMVVADDSRFKLHPCIEVNLRMNMGIIAHELYRKRLDPEARGIFRLSFFPDSVALRTFSAEHALSHLSVYRDGKLWHGYLPLTPINDDTRHHAYILCE